MYLGLLTLTAMMYAIVKKVVRPARSSVVNLAFLISLGFDSQCYVLLSKSQGRRTCPDPSRWKYLPTKEAETTSLRAALFLSMKPMMFPETKSEKTEMV
jgi:hypothetical protein